MTPVIEEICALCGESYPYFHLQRCSRCGRLYCRSCVATLEGSEILCLNCARRIISPRGSRSKYAHLSIYLARKAKYTDSVSLSFKEIEEMIGDHLPFSAYHYNQWWSNIRGRSPSEAWLTTGWKVREVSLESQKVTFMKKETPEPVALTLKKRRRRLTESFKALARKPPRKRKEPSNTKLAKIKAKLMNIGRRPAAPRYRGKFKPKGAYEKRLYKSEEKPDES